MIMKLCWQGFWVNLYSVFILNFLKWALFDVQSQVVHPSSWKAFRRQLFRIWRMSVFRHYLLNRDTKRRNEPNVTNHILTSVSSFSIIVTFFLAENDSNPESWKADIQPWHWNFNFSIFWQFLYLVLSSQSKPRLNIKIARCFESFTKIHR